MSEFSSFFRPVLEPQLPSDVTWEHFEDVFAYIDALVTHTDNGDACMFATVRGMLSDALQTGELHSFTENTFRAYVAHATRNKQPEGPESPQPVCDIEELDSILKRDVDVKEVREPACDGHIKRHILRRHMFADNSVSSSPTPHTPSNPECGTRYLNNKIVSNKNERYIVIKPEE